jgi:hypothetical protein
MAAPFELKRIAVDSSSWTAITAPFACSRVVVTLDDLANNMKIRTNSADSATERQIQGGIDFLLNTAKVEESIRNDRIVSRHVWAIGDTVCFIQTTGGTGPIVAAFTV